jgi:hypothetical protein
MRMLEDLEELNGLPVERDLIDGEGEESNEDEKNSDLRPSDGALI